MERMAAVWGAAALWCFAAFLSPCFAQEREPVPVAKIATKDDGAVRAAEIISEEDGTLRILDLKTGQEKSVVEDDVVDIERGISEDEAIKWAGLAPYLAWRIGKAQEVAEGGQIAEVTPTAVYVNLGTHDGIGKGDRLKVLRVGDAITDPETGEVLGVSESLLAELEVVESHERFSKTKRVSEMKTELRRGDAVRPRLRVKPVAVLPLSPTSEDLADLAKGLSEEFATTLAARGVSVVERAQIDRVVAELGLQSGALVDKDTAAKLGKLVGAHAVLTGTVVPSNGDDATVHARLIRVETAEVILAIGHEMQVNAKGAAVSPAVATPVLPVEPLGYRWVSRDGQVKGNVFLRADGAFMCDSGQLVKDVDYWCNSTRDKANRWDLYEWEVTQEGLALTFLVGRWLLVPGVDGSFHGRYIGKSEEGRGQTVQLVPHDRVRHAAFVRWLMAEQARLTR